MNLTAQLSAAARSLLRDRAQVAPIVLMLALGIGVVTAMAGLVDSIFVKPLPFANGERLVVIHNRYGHGDATTRASSSPPDYKDRVDFARTLESIAAWAPRSANLTGRGEPQRLPIGRATASLREVLGVQPVAGRWFTVAEDEAGAEVVVLSSGLAERLFGSAGVAVGQSLVLDGVSRGVIGVMPPSFDCAPSGAAAWTPLGLGPDDFSNDERGNEYLETVARLRADVSLDEARADMQSIAEGVVERDPSRADFLGKAGWGAIVTPLREELYGGLARTATMLLAFGAFVLLLCLANTVQLAVVRTIRRRETLAIREAVGAGRAQLVAQLTFEALLLGVMAGAAGLAIPWAVFEALNRPAAVVSLRSLTLGIDLRVAAFAAFSGIVCGLVAAIGPLFASRGALASSLSAGRSGSHARGARRLRGALTVVETALAFTLVVGGLAIWSEVRRLVDVDPGFRADRVATMRLALPSDTLDLEGRRAFTSTLLERLEDEPAVEAAAIVTSFPMSGEVWTASFDVEGRSDLDSPGANIRIASPGYFALLDIPVLEGEIYGDETDESARRVVLNEAAAKRYWPARSAVGQRITFSDADDPEIIWWTVAGVVGSVRDEDLALDAEPHVYFPSAQRPPRSFFVAVRMSGGTTGAETLFREAVRALDPALPVWDVRTADEYLESSLAAQRFRLGVLWAFGVTGLLLAAMGVYGVVAFAFSLASAEHAVRLAIGATRGDLVKHGLAWMALPLGAGLVLGWLISAGLGSFVGAGGAAGVPTMAGASILVTLVVLLAALVPALRMSKIDPVVALRSV